MAMKQLDYYRVNLHILSPIHVGTGQELDPFSFVIHDNQLYLFDLIKWIEVYPEKEQLYSMMDSDNFTLVRSFIAENLDIEKTMVCSVSVESQDLLKTYKKAIQERDPRNQVLINPMTRNEVSMAAYIPGSSIKGAIRTAIANRFVKAAGVTVEDSRSGHGFYNEKIFGRIHEDPMRWLKVSDVPLTHNGTVIVEAREFSINPDKAITPKGHVEVTQNLCLSKKEIIYPLQFSMAPFEMHGKQVNLEFLIDSLYRFYIPKYAEEFLKFYKPQRAAEIRKEIALMNQAVESLKTNETIIRIGHFSHVECVTLDGVRKPKTRRGNNGRPLPWGTTRTLANGVYPFGWAKLEFLDLDSLPRPKREWVFSSGEEEYSHRKRGKLKSQRSESEKKKPSLKSLKSLQDKWKK